MSFYATQKNRSKEAIMYLHFKPLFVILLVVSLAMWWGIIKAALWIFS